MALRFYRVERGKTLLASGRRGPAAEKSTTGYSLLQLIKPTSGRVIVDGIDIANLSQREMRPYRRRLQIIFQDAAASLDPRMSVGDLIGEALDIHGLARRTARLPRIRKLLDLVGIPARLLQRFPHELSGGQAQRVAICRALAVEPMLIVCDEPVSALDVSIQAQIINLMQDDFRKNWGWPTSSISHDLSVRVRHISDRIAVMYLGRIVETADKHEIFGFAGHPYTKALLSAVPVPDPDMERTRERIVLRGDLPSPKPTRRPTAAGFRTRCPVTIDDCARIDPPWKTLSVTHHAACIRI